MRYLKTYATDGAISASKVFTADGIRLRANFEGGSITADGQIPAVFRTSDLLVQHAIENSPQFARNEVYLLEKMEMPWLEDPEEEVFEEEQPKEEEDNDGEKTKDGGNSVESVTNFQTARSVLMKDYNVPLSELQNKEALLQKAAELNINFPNWQ